MSVSRAHESESQSEQTRFNLKIQNIKQSIGAHICDLVDDVLAEEKKLQARTSVPMVAASRDGLSNANEELKKIMRAEEGHRHGGDISKELTDKVKESRKQVKQLRQQLEQLQRSYFDDKKNFETKIGDVSLRIQTEVDLAFKQDAGEVKDMAVLEEKKRTAKEAYDRAVLAYNNKCCCLPSFLAKEIKEMETTEAALKAVENEIMQLKTTQAESKAMKEQFRKELAEDQGGKEKLICEYPQKKRALEEQIRAADKIRVSAEADWEAEKERLVSQVANKSMMYYLRVYVCFLRFCDQMLDALRQQKKNKDILHFNEYLNDNELVLEDYMGKIHCLDPAKRNVLQVYQDVFLRKLDGAAKTAVIAGSWDDALQDAIVPAISAQPRINSAAFFAAKPVPPLATATASPVLTPKRS